MSAFNTLNSLGMESQVTLVDTAVYGTPQTVISFVRDDMKNTRILSADERLLYSVDTDKISNSHTILKRAETDEVVAEIKRKDLFPDTVKFGKGEKMKLSNWMSGVKGKWSDFPVSFVWQSIRYTWKANSARQIALYKETDPHNPIAWFQTSKRQVLDGVPTVFRALLALQPEAQDILDPLILSLLVVENELRMKQKQYINADGRATFQANYF